MIPKVEVFYCDGHGKLRVWKVTNNGKRMLIPNLAYIQRLFREHEKGTLHLTLRNRKCPKCLG